MRDGLAEAYAEERRRVEVMHMAADALHQYRLSTDYIEEARRSGWAPSDQLREGQTLEEWLEWVRGPARRVHPLGDRRRDARRRRGRRSSCGGIWVNRGSPLYRGIRCATSSVRRSFTCSQPLFTHCTIRHPSQSILCSWGSWQGNEAPHESEIGCQRCVT